jgi:hypothetical protein
VDIQVVQVQTSRLVEPKELMVVLAVEHLAVAVAEQVALLELHLKLPLVLEVKVAPRFMDLVVVVAVVQMLDTQQDLTQQQTQVVVAMEPIVVLPHSLAATVVQDIATLLGRHKQWRILQN